MPRLWREMRQGWGICVRRRKLGLGRVLGKGTDSHNHENQEQQTWALEGTQPFSNIQERLPR
jgi:hypothetical protein